MGARRGLAVATAALAWFGLILQFVIFAQAVGLATAGWRFIGFFTILSNFAIGCIATAIAAGGENRLTSPRAMLMGLTAIITVGFVYSLLLRSLWDPQGLQKIADAILHDMTPILFALLWAIGPHGALRWTDLKWALVPPALYLAYAMTRGAFDGWYPYYFLDPALQSAAELVTGIGGVLAVFALIAASGIAIDRRLAARRAEARPG
ncbi:Pr6Pr family membrane protein [Sphingomonas xanthus]|uniref:Pr6Pr family membrane protein n=1 Tax=Sphingomonas xanthus TaxID=2594473 RepID=A0A516IT29_9SPHN|nr:Pr6Pr family membrane protein [Sphingomonas xanthus]QDP20047.1 hypothetical protein FMM02_08805 [Sphingomonas xanthus]